MPDPADSTEHLETDRLKFLARHTSTIVVFTNAKREIEWVNSAFTNLTGYTLEEVRGKSPSLLQGPETDQRTVARMRRALHAGKEVREEILNYTRDGKSYWLHIEIFPHKKPDGELIGFMALETEITARRKREEALQNFRSAVEHSPVSILITNAEGLIEYVNPDFEKASGYSFQEVQGQSTSILKSQLNDDSFFRKMWHQIASGRIWRGVFQNRRKDGTIFPVSASIAPVFDSEMRIVRYISVMADITESQVLEQNLRQAMREAEAANRAKSAFLATMSHEIRTPLNAMIGMASLLEESGIPEELKEHVSTIVSAGDTLLDLINDVLDYSKLESNRVELSLEPVLLEDLLLDPLQLFHGPAFDKSIELSHFIDPTLPQVLLADRVRLKQVLLNLLSNAVKFTRQGHVQISAHKVSLPDGSWEILFRVEDTGIGIDPDALPKLFQPFSQADSSVTREFGGSGLGLVISQRVVRLMGGEILVDSSPGQGSSFAFQLHLEEASIPDPVKIDLSCLNKKTMLVVDDVDVNRRLLSAFGFQWGMQVLEAANADAALELLSKDISIDVIILDFQMPGRDGAALAEQITQFPQRKNLPRILLTSYHDVNREFPAGLFRAVLQKPLRTTRLKQILVRLLQAPVHGDDEPELASDFSTLRLLLAEDNPNNQAVLKLMLRKLHCQAVIVPTGKEAVDLATKEDFDGVILDLQMPVMDGLTAVGVLKNHFQRLPLRPILVALTANAFPEDEKKCLDSGFDLYLAKPVSFRIIRGLLEKIHLRKNPPGC